MVSMAADSENVVDLEHPFNEEKMAAFNEICQTLVGASVIDNVYPPEVPYIGPLILADIGVLSRKNFAPLALSSLSTRVS